MQSAGTKKNLLPAVNRPIKEAYLVSIVESTLLQDMLLCLVPFHHCQLTADTADMQDTSGNRHS